MLYLMYDVTVEIIYTCYITLYNIFKSSATMNLTNLFSFINPKEVLTNLPDAVLVIDSEGKIIWANDKSSVIFETNKENLKGLYFDELVANGLELAERSFSRRNSVVTGAFTISGKEFFVEMNAKKYVEQYFITIRDITAMTNVLANAERTGRLNKEKNVMFVKLGNEIKSPIQSIIGFSQALLDGLGGAITDKQDKYVKIINKNSKELLYFMDKFLEFAHAESSLLEFNKQPFDITNLIKLVIKVNEGILNNKSINIDYNFENINKKTVSSDEACVKMAIQNIIDVIIKSIDKGTISIKVDNPDMETLEQSKLKLDENTDENSYIRIEIKDSGMGYTDAEMDGIFEPYTQLDNANKKTVTRSITLGTSYLIIRRLGGTINLSSKIMQGSTFTILLPVDKEIQ